MITSEQAERIRDAFHKGALRVQSVSPEGDVEWRRVEQTHRNEVPWETIYEHQTAAGPLVSTGGHSIYLDPKTTIKSEEVREGALVLGVGGTDLVQTQILGVKRLSARRFMYDLTVEAHHNFVLHRSKVVVHNCPDRHYHFSPPEHESQIGQYNRVFGFVWEDMELLHYLRASLDWWNMYPPNTTGIACSLQIMVTNKFTASWKTAILWGAIVHAMFALSRNWLHDEFDYSIGGISLSISKSGGYESLKNNAESQLDKAVQAKKDTVLFIRGLQQPKYGIGIRSSFGPHVGSGVLSPRSFLVWIFATLPLLPVLASLYDLSSGFLQT